MENPFSQSATTLLSRANVRPKVGFERDQRARTRGNTRMTESRQPTTDTSATRLIISLTDEEWVVKNMRVVNGQRELRLDDGNKITVRRFAPIGKGDILTRIGESLYVQLRKASGSVPLTPAWKTSATLQVDREIPVVVKEIETPEELEGYQRLTEYHYRGNRGVGRRVPLIACVDCWELPSVVGFIELASCFLVNTARTRVLDTLFSDPSRGVAWTRWKTNSITTGARNRVVPQNSVVRISRCVVFPELRGVGLAKVLVDAAVAFGQQRWHLGGVQPSFMEITAEMLRYWPFVRGNGFLYIGDTDGNEHRVEGDMRYLLRRSLRQRGLPQGGGGILSLQRSHAVLLRNAMDQRGLTLKEVLDYLRRSPDKLSDEDWIQLYRIFRRGKPTYMCSLTREAEIFLNRKCRDDVGRATMTPGKGSSLVMDAKGLNISVTSRPVKSARARRVQEAFGIVNTEFKSTLVAGLDLTVLRGQVILVGGPSGTGKSLLLRAIRYIVGVGARKGRLPDGVSLEVERATEGVRVVWPRAIPKTMAPIELLERFPLDEALRILASAGLAEAQLFVRPARTLSLGQSYRLGLALALAEDPELLLIDEFCEPLDRFSAAAVSRKLRAAATQRQMAVIVATADPERVSCSLTPDRILLLSSGGTHKWVCVSSD